MLEGMSVGPIFAAIQTLIPWNMRATAQALVSLLPSCLGAGLGPLAVGVLSDSLHARFGDQSLRYSMLGLCPGYLWAAAYLWRASRSVSRDVAAQPDKPGRASIFRNTTGDPNGG